MVNVRIRDAIPADAGAIAKIYAHYVETTCVTFEETAPPAGEILARMQKVMQAGLPWYAAETPGGEVVGYAYASPFHPRSAYRFTLENSVYVDPTHVGAGIGTALMNRLMDECARRGYRQMIALIGDRANDASIRLHAGLGFEPIGALSGVGLKFGRWADAVLMQRPLGDGAGSIPVSEPGNGKRIN